MLFTGEILKKTSLGLFLLGKCYGGDRFGDLNAYLIGASQNTWSQALKSKKIDNIPIDKCVFKSIVNNQKNITNGITPSNFYKTLNDPIESSDKLYKILLESIDSKELSVDKVCEQLFSSTPSSLKSIMSGNFNSLDLKKWCLNYCMYNTTNLMIMYWYQYNYTKYPTHPDNEISYIPYPSVFQSFQFSNGKIFGNCAKAFKFKSETHKTTFSSFFLESRSYVQAFIFALNLPKYYYVKHGISNIKYSPLIFENPKKLHVASVSTGYISSSKHAHTKEKIFIVEFNYTDGDCAFDALNLSRTKISNKLLEYYKNYTKLQQGQKKWFESSVKSLSNIYGKNIPLNRIVQSASKTIATPRLGVLHAIYELMSCMFDVPIDYIFSSSKNMKSGLQIANQITSCPSITQNAPIYVHCLPGHARFCLPMRYMCGPAPECLTTVIRAIKSKLNKQDKQEIDRISKLNENEKIRAIYQPNEGKIFEATELDLL
ncbi:MAG: hypothetical protein IJ481_02300 [Alphaproteobacteria bacterium]|nr:hypothetical protein [Alphaproteobacteria bacterium]